MTIPLTPELQEYRDSVDDGCKWPDCECTEQACCDGMEDLCAEPEHADIERDGHV